MHNFAWSRRKGLPFNSYSKDFGGKTFQLSQKMCILVFSKIVQIFSWGGREKRSSRDFRFSLCIDCDFLRDQNAKLTAGGIQNG